MIQVNNQYSPISLVISTAQWLLRIHDKDLTLSLQVALKRNLGSPAGKSKNHVAPVHENRTELFHPSGNPS